MDRKTIPTIESYWTTYLGCSFEAADPERFQIVPHASGLADYWGVFALFREGLVIVSAPGEIAGKIEALLATTGGILSHENFVQALQPVAERIIGPAFIGYAPVVPDPTHPARTIDPDDAPFLEALRHACDPTEWEHGGGPIGSPSSGVFVGRNLVALASYEIWGETIAHISIIAHPDFRGQGFGRSAVAHLAARAIASGLVPQYRTLEANAASIRVARSLGFDYYATSVAVRLKPKD